MKRTEMLTMPEIGKSVLGTTRLRILGLLLGKSGRTYREMAAIIGCHQTNIFRHMEALHKKGLVNWERGGNGRSLCATAHPLVKFIPASQLGEP